jgi:hypothetical protein
MKRLVDGATYNTETATLLARSEYPSEWNYQDGPAEAALFQTRKGAFFVVEFGSAAKLWRTSGLLMATLGILFRNRCE